MKGEVACKMHIAPWGTGQLYPGSCLAFHSRSHKRLTRPSRSALSRPSRPAAPPTCCHGYWRKNSPTAWGGRWWWTTAPDGYTLLMSSNVALVTNPHLYKRLGFDPLNDFAPISVVGKAGNVLVVHPSVPVRSVAQLLALARARPGQLNFGSGGRGTGAHVAGEILKTATGINIVHVPYKGGILAVIDLVAGQIDMVFSDMVPAMPQIKGGKLRALAVTSEQRSPTLPDLPTMVEAGVKEPIPDTWWAMLAPRGTPAAIISRLNADLAQIMKLPDVQEKYAGLGVFTVHTTPERVMELVRIETPKMGKILKAAGVEPD